MSVYDLYVDGVRTKTASGIPSVSQTNGLSFARNVSDGVLASHGWFKRVDFVPETGYVIVPGTQTLTPDSLNGLSIESYDVITEEESEAIRQASKSNELKINENNFLAYCESLGFEGKAASAEIEAVLIDMATAALEVGDMAEYAQANLFAHAAHSLIHEVEIHGGTWFDIPDTPHDI